jgi:S1-C subfamily serine protease
VLSADGRALGLASAGLVRGEALLVPAPTLRRSVEAMLTAGGPRRGYLGVATFAVRLGPVEAGVAGQRGALLVSGVEPESPAARAGLLLGDALLGVDGQPLAGPRDLAPVLAPERVGSAAAVRLLRAGAVRELSLTVGAREPRPATHGCRG